MTDPDPQREAILQAAMKAVDLAGLDPAAGTDLRECAVGLVDGEHLPNLMRALGWTPPPDPEPPFYPCKRSDAHGPHPWTTQFDQVFTCDGRLAHPSTTIGGAHDGRPAAYGQIDVGPLTGGTP